MTDTNNYYILMIVLLSSIWVIFNVKSGGTKEHFLGPIIKPLKAVGNFVTNFPVIFGVLVDAIINFVLNFVDIMLSLVDIVYVFTHCFLRYNYYCYSLVKSNFYD